MTSSTRSSSLAHAQAVRLMHAALVSLLLPGLVSSSSSSSSSASSPSFSSSSSSSSSPSPSPPSFSSSSSSSSSSFSRSDEEAIERFRQYLRVRTDHPSPDYEAAADYLLSQAREIGLGAQRIELVRGKPIILMTWQGRDPDLPALLLNSHMDVVAAERDKWMYDPFAAVRTPRGDIYARGAHDTKCVAIQHLEAIRRLRFGDATPANREGGEEGERVGGERVGEKRVGEERAGVERVGEERVGVERVGVGGGGKGYIPLRTVHVSFVPDEEIGGKDGMERLVAWEGFRELNVGFALDEGKMSEGSKYRVLCGERLPFAVMLKATGSPDDPPPDHSYGHGDSGVERLINSLTSIMEFRRSQFDLVKSGRANLTDVVSVNVNFLKFGAQHSTTDSSSTTGGGGGGGGGIRQRLGPCTGAARDPHPRSSSDVEIGSGSHSVCCSARPHAAAAAAAIPIPIRAEAAVAAIPIQSEAAAAAIPIQSEAAAEDGEDATGLMDMKLLLSTPIPIPIPATSDCNVESLSHSTKMEEEGSDVAINMKKALQETETAMAAADVQSCAHFVRADEDEIRTDAGQQAAVMAADCGNLCSDSTENAKVGVGVVGGGAGGGGREGGEEEEAIAGIDFRLPAMADAEAFVKRLEEEWAPRSMSDKRGDSNANVIQKGYEVLWKRPSPSMGAKDEGGKPKVGSRVMTMMITPTNQSNPYWMVFKKAVEKTGVELSEPEISPAATDASFLRATGLLALGFTPVRHTPTLAHAHNEYVNDKDFVEGISAFVHVIRDISSMA
ncbi:hypothetical protein CBR_g38106 [Chara braunii]|uniref:Peptidase M20 dimerisation domain-containing protein n=1 Tax=Chara braunii TaxID=69332 RepID=A0A388LPJ5_CHABU|nr:hypothetical protein CBR_g38106 [Chara braunii]|eukprot:GBG84132.1 hypothetical protein CBR_g38106 [Chara braunii]